MYIAFKWLVLLALVQWLGMCIIDSVLKENVKFCSTSLGAKKVDNYKNDSLQIKLLPVTNEPISKDALHSYYKTKSQHSTSLHLLMFIAGAFAVTAFHKKRDVIVFAHRKIPTVNNIAISELYRNSKIAAKKLQAAIKKYSLHFREKIKINLTNIVNLVNSCKNVHSVKQDNVNIILMKKIKEMADEKKSLGELLISALRENKNIRMRYELETMTKNRLIQHVEDSQKQVKENRSKYMSFQQSYLITCQENTYLKARLGKLKQEKKDAEKDLMDLINQVYLSKNKDLLTYCTRFLVKTKTNLLNSDVDADIKEFLENSRKSSEINLNAKHKPSEMSLNGKFSVKKLNKMKIPSSTSVQITEIVNEEDCLVALVEPDAPKLRGLPGEYVWTVKDKDGLIEKLYEYNYDSDLDGKETIRRIKQYSVYYDRDCLLDFSRSKSQVDVMPTSSHSSSKILQYSWSNKNIVTGSEAFQNFLKSSSSIMQIKPSASSLLPR